MSRREEEKKTTPSLRKTEKENIYPEKQFVRHISLDHQSSYSTKLILWQQVTTQ